MSLWSRFILVFRSKATATLDGMEDPEEVLNYAYEQQQEILVRVKQGLVDVATSKRQIERQTERIQERIPHLEDQARRALQIGRDDLARTALERRQGALAELSDLMRQVDEVAEEEDRLVRTEQALAARIDEFRSRRTVMSARYVAAKAQVRVNEALTGVSGELAELGRALGRAEEKTDRMQARAAALDAMLDPRSLALPLGGDEIERALRQASAARTVEVELLALKQEANPALTSSEDAQGRLIEGNGK